MRGSSPSSVTTLALFLVQPTATAETETTTQHRISRRLNALGVCGSVTAGQTDDCWAEIVDDLDRFSALGFGPATQRRFLLAPHPRLGAAPLEVLTEDEGPQRVRAALRATLIDAFASRG